jgi:hypothetical protein
VTQRVQTENQLSEHRFVLLGNDFAIRAASPRFCFQHTSGETCAGLAMHNGELVLSFGHRDGGAHLARVPYEGVRAILWPE